MVDVIQIGKRKWLAGMDWASYETMPSKDDLHEDAVRLNANWSVLRKSQDCIQAGFAPALEGIKPVNLYSLAAMLADSRKQPWLGMFEIAPDLWWFIAVRDHHAILPKGDVLGTQQEIVQARDAISGFQDWNYEGGDLTALEKMIDEVEARPTPVKSLESSPALNKILVAVGILGVAAAAGGYWWQQEQEAAEQRAAMALLRAQLENSQAAPATPSAVTNFAFPTVLLQACGDALHRPISEFGWLIGNASCNSESATISWTRQDGATIETRPPGVLSADGEFVTETISLAGARTSSDDRIALNDAWERLLSWAQAAGFKVTSTAIAQPAAPLPGAEGASPVAVSIERSITLSIKVSPFDLDLSDIPGLRLNSIKQNATGWEIGGTLYGR